MVASDATAASVREALRRGLVIPAHPLALDDQGRFDERSQRALTRYYVAAGAGGIAVGVHTTQFAIRRPEVGLYRPVLELAAETARVARAGSDAPFVKVAGVCGHTRQAISEAEFAAALGYDVALLSLGDWRDEPESALLAHCAAVSDVMPVFGFYLQPAVGGRPLSYAFWRELAELPGLWAIKIAPFDRYATLDVVRAVSESGRDEVALYTGNDDSIIIDLLTPFPVSGGSGEGVRWIDGGLLGQWAVWTRRAVETLDRVTGARHAALASSGDERRRTMITLDWLREAAALTDANGAIFDAAHRFAGCVPGIHEVLRRQGLIASTRCLDPDEVLSPGQRAEIDRVCAAYPWLTDDDFVREHLDAWRA